MMTNTKTILMILLMFTASLAGCLGSDENEEITSKCSGDELVIAFEVKEDMITIAYYLADDSESNACQAHRWGVQADRLAMLAMNIDGGPAWVVNLYDVMALTKSDGHYDAHALRFRNCRHW